MSEDCCLVTSSPAVECRQRQSRGGAIAAAAITAEVAPAKGNWAD